MRKLNAWKRLGIVLSVIWAVGAGGYEYFSTINRASDFGALAAKVCDDSREARHLPYDEAACWTGHDSPFRKNYAIMAEGVWPGTLFLALAPLPFFWLIAWGVIAVVRWVLRGRDVTANDTGRT